MKPTLPSGRLTRAVERGLKRWREQDTQARPPPEPEALPAQEPSLARLVAEEPLSEVSEPSGPREGVVRPLPRRVPLAVAPAPGARGLPEPTLTRGPLRVGRTQVLRRLFVWLRALVLLLAGILGDVLRHRNTREGRAIRLRQAFERIGGTATKIGQQLAMRTDLLPSACCAELSKTFDRAPPFAVEQATSLVEHATGRPLRETFQVFDPKPIGSASVSCVYQAVLMSGERVAVKVRRPGIAEAFAADCEALRWLAAVLETLTLLRSGFTRNVLNELRSMLMEELNFVKEARNQELFRDRGRRLGWASSPRRGCTMRRVARGCSSRSSPWACRSRTCSGRWSSGTRPCWSGWTWRRISNRRRSRGNCCASITSASSRTSCSMEIRTPPTSWSSRAASW